MDSLWICLFVVVVFQAVAAVPVIIDTDIGYSTDDLSAVATALQRPELDVKLIVTATGNTEERARVLAKFLTMIGREETSLGIGIVTSKTLNTLAEWADDFDLTSYKGEIYKDGVAAMASVIQQSKERVSIMAIAPANNILSFTERFPDLISKADVWSMSGSVYRGYHNSSVPVAEYNVRYCPVCARAMYQAQWSVTVTPLDTSGVVSLKNQSFELLLKSTGPTALAFNEVTLFHAFKTSFPIHQGTEILYDAAAPLMMVNKERFLEFETLPIYVTEEGKTIVSEEKGVPIRVALYWKAAGLSEGEMWIAETLGRAESAPQ